MISEKDIEHLAELSRIAIKAEQKEKLTRDLFEILEYMRELKEVDTSGVSPMGGGTMNRNVFRNDAEERSGFDAEAARNAFPEQEGGFLKVPPVFE